MAAASRFARVAVLGAGGPHVTPTAFAIADGRIWFVAAASTVKVRALRRRSAASVLFSDGPFSVVVCGRGSVMSMTNPREIFQLLRQPLSTVAAGAMFTLRNSELLVRAAIDNLGWRGPGLPSDLVLVAIEPARGMLLEGLDVVDQWGRWPASSPPPRARRRRPAPVFGEGLPSSAASLLGQPRPGAVGWRTSNGVVTLPAFVDARGHALVSEASLRLAGGVDAGPACVSTDREAPRPSGFAGVMARGPGWAIGRRGAGLLLAVEPEKVHWWAGFRAGTAPR
ncbi:MAG: hypothetical protein NVSMB17_00510 [Candidatus Dormibacteria bacterium]